METLLNIYDNPPTITYTSITYPLSILYGEEKYNKWFYSNYVNITSVIDPYDSNRVNFLSGDSYGGVEPLVYKKVTLTDEKDVFEQLLSLFNDGWYVFTFLDFNALGIPPYMVHNILIYGIDFDSRKVQVLCYVNRQFVRASIEFEIFLEAYNSQNNNRKALTRCMKKKDKEIDFSYENYETQLMDYFRSQFSYDKISNYYCNIAHRIPPKLFKTWNKSILQISFRIFSL